MIKDTMMPNSRDRVIKAANRARLANKASAQGALIRR